MQIAPRSRVQDIAPIHAGELLVYRPNDGLNGSAVICVRNVATVVDLVEACDGHLPKEHLVNVQVLPSLTPSCHSIVI